MKIREFVPQDVKRVVDIEGMSFDQPYGMNMFLKLHEMGVGFLVAEKDGYVVGYIIFLLKSENIGHIISIAIDKNYRRLKVGTKLLSRAIMILGNCNVDNITLEVNENNTAALEFYKSFNFTIDRLVPDYYGNNENAIVMNLVINFG